MDEVSQHPSTPVHALDQPIYFKESIERSRDSELVAKTEFGRSLREVKLKLRKRKSELMHDNKCSNRSRYNRRSRRKLKMIEESFHDHRVVTELALKVHDRV